MNLQFKDIINPEFQAELQESLTFATGFGVVFIDKEGRHIGDCGNFCRFCREINSTQIGRTACERSNLEGMNAALSTREPSIFLCHAGLVSFVIPLLYEDEYIGAITAGQVLCDDMSDFPQYLMPPVDWLEDPKLRKCHDELQIFSRQQIESAAVVFRNISNYIIQTAAYNKMQRERMAEETRRLQLEHQLKLAELDALQKQVTPHFIFNVLSSVSRLLESEEYETAGKMLSSFTSMMRYTLSDISTAVTLKQELGYVQNYLSIQKIRFGARIRCRVDCPEELNCLRMPFFALQPLVENAIEHGIVPRAAGGGVEVVCRQSDGRVTICVKDDGVGIPEDKLENLRGTLSARQPQDTGGHVGLYNSSRRFFHLYGKSVAFTIDSAVNAGTAVCITITEPLGLSDGTRYDEIM